MTTSPGSSFPSSRSVTPAAQMAGPVISTVKGIRYRGGILACEISSHAIRIPAADPAVPGATGEYPQPNQEASRIGKRGRLVVFLIRLILQVGRCRNYVLFRSPVPEVENAAAFA